MQNTSTFYEDTTATIPASQTMTSKIAIVLGAGANIGAATVQTFKAHGYKVAYASRSVSDSKSASDNDLAIRCDFAKPASVSDLFETVRKTWGEPSVVIYNGISTGYCP